jgi:NAD(P)-dependent dehydrogenase (short-subunit alcohol dehydrogenase family)
MRRSTGSPNHSRRHWRIDVDDPTRMFRLDGRTAILTGASSGLGVVMAEALAGAGANVVLAARRAERIAELERSIQGAGGQAIAVPCDVSREGDVDRLIAAAQERFGSIDVLVNNAGVAHPQPAEQESLDEFKRILDTNINGVFLCSQRCSRVMLAAGKGVIVNIASVLGMVGAGQIPQASYTASKGAVVNLTRELAAQWARRGIRVNALLPGWFPSEMTAEMFDSDDGKRWIRTRTPMGRAGDPRELSGALLFLASDASSYVTGAMVLVDGGWTTV